MPTSLTNRSTPNCCVMSGDNSVQANVIHHLLAGDPDSIPQGGDPVDRTLFLRKVTEEALRVTRYDLLHGLSPIVDRVTQASF